MRFNEEHLDGRYFSPWTPYTHPELGEVEIGGWHAKFWGQNPPAEFLEEECAAQLPWIFFLVQQAPRLALEGPTVSPVGDGTFRVHTVLTNRGFLPTSLTGRGAVGEETSQGGPGWPIVGPPVMSLSLRGAELVEGRARVQLGHLRGTGAFLPEVGPARQTAEWIIRPQETPAYIQVTAQSDKGGVVRSGWMEVR
jgi:hypothetical protein